MRIEPHSPCPYLVKRAVAWGKMPLTELLQEMVRSEGDLQELYGMLGMRPWKSGEPK
jgi:type VI secretion system protein ImpA